MKDSDNKSETGETPGEKHHGFKKKEENSRSHHHPRQMSFSRVYDSTWAGKDLNCTPRL